MSTHCYRCIIHPQHNKVGVCGLCVRERLVALAEDCSSNSCVEGKRCTSPASAGSASADGPYHSFSSSSAREYRNQLSPPGAPPAEPQSGGEQAIYLPPPAGTSLLQKLKLKAFISIPASPERAFFKSNGSDFHSPSRPTVYHHQKNTLSLPFKNSTYRRSSVSEPTEGLYMHSKVAPEMASDDQNPALSTMSSGGHRKPSLMTLFHQNEVVAADTTNHTAFVDDSEKAIRAPSQEQWHRIEQFSAAMRSPGFAIPSNKVAVLSDNYRQTHTAEYLQYHSTAGAPAQGLAKQSSNSSSSSWITSLFQRKKQRGASKLKSKAGDSEAPLVNGALEEASARFSVDYAGNVSVDSGGMTPSLKHLIRSRVQHGEVPHIQVNDVGAKPRYTQVNSEHLDAKLDPYTGSTANKVGIQNEHYMNNHGGYNAEEARHFPRSRSWGRAWSKSQPSQFLTTSPQHHLLGSSKQHFNNNNANLSSLHQQQQYHYLTSTPKHPPTMEARAPKDSRLAFGSYFGPFRRSKRQAAGGATGFHSSQS